MSVPLPATSRVPSSAIRDRERERFGCERGLDAEDDAADDASAFAVQGVLDRDGSRGERQRAAIHDQPDADQHVVRNVLNIANVQSYYQQIVMGTLIVVAVTIDRFFSTRT